MGKSIYVTLCLAMAMVSMGCGKKERPAEPTPKAGKTATTQPATKPATSPDSSDDTRGLLKISGKLTIAVIPKGTSHLFWKSVHFGAQQGAASEGGVEIIWKGGIKEDDLEAQVKVIEDFIARKVDGIVLAPLHDKALKRQVADAKAAGIPVVIFDSDLDSKDQVSFVATDNYAGGVKAGEKMLQLLGDKGGKIVMVRYVAGHASTGKREQGFLDTVKKGKNIEILSENLYGGPDVDTAVKTAENLLPKLRQADGVYTPNEPTSYGMLLVLQQNALAGKIKFVGFDGSPKLAAGLAAGQVDALVLQDPINMGKLAVINMVKHLRGEKVKEFEDTGCALATKENMDKPEIKNLLTPELK
ncbi:MAG: substrate-binding domain-containing protein [Planctomycetaceae bacterium]|nr:substrate-binding domain-containing protein [Planctomycetaceae bacterium]